MSKAIIVGGGIVGLSSALYLRQSGWDVTVLDMSDMRNNCSYGNAGYICPSHFIPLATPCHRFCAVNAPIPLDEEHRVLFVLNRCLDRAS